MAYDKKFITYLYSKMNIMYVLVGLTRSPTFIMTRFEAVHDGDTSDTALYQLQFTFNLAKEAGKDQILCAMDTGAMSNGILEAKYRDLCNESIP